MSKNDAQPVDTVIAGKLHTKSDPFRKKMASRGIDEVMVAGRLLRPGSRVRLQPRPEGNIIDMVLVGRVAVIEAFDEDDAGVVHVAVVLEDDPGRGQGGLRHPAHRFYFSPGELVPLDVTAERPRNRILVAGVGNVFLGDHGFGVAVAKRLLERRLPKGMEIVDFGIRGIDLAHALVRGYDGAILVDTVPRGRPPGSIYVIEPRQDDGECEAMDSHQVNPLAVLGLARNLGALPAQILIVGCEPEPTPGDGAPEGMTMEMSPVVAAAVDPACEMVIDLACRLAIAAA